MQINRSLVFIFLIVCITESGSANMKGIYLDQIVGGSDLIVIGTTVRIVEIANDEGFGSRGVATIRVERVMKGSIRDKEVEIIYVPCVQASSPQYYLCEKCIFFLEKAEGKFFSGIVFRGVGEKYITAGGYFGKIGIRTFDDMVINILLEGEDRDQKLSEFLQKIVR